MAAGSMNGNLGGISEQHDPRELIADLVDRKLGRDQIKEIQSTEKDPNRFDTYLGIIQERVPWPEQVILAIHDHLFIVAKDGRAITKALCGHEFGDWRENWKLHSRIRVRRTEAELLEIYEPGCTIDPRVVDFREFICPGCGVLLDVDAVPPNYPIERDFLPDLRAFYEEWLDRPLPADVGDYEERSPAVIAGWARSAGDLHPAG
jgi:acetone carboxylase gamma subunit